MQQYGECFARVYEYRWQRFASEIAPRILNYYEENASIVKNKEVLDLGCGTGLLAHYLLEHGYKVTGIDISPYMLNYAKTRNKEYIQQHKAEFIQADISKIKLNKKYELITSTFNTLNHLDSFLCLRKCFNRVYKLLVSNGIFLFDLNTLYGIKCKWDRIIIDDEKEDVFLVRRGVFSYDMEKAYGTVMGFIKNEAGTFDRFRETVYCTPFNLDQVRNVLIEIGWREVSITSIDNLQLPLEKPEQEQAVFFIAKK